MLLTLAVMLSAAFVDQNRAQKLAETHYKTYAPSEALVSNTVQRILPRMYNGQVTMYTVVFNDGFVIVTAEDNLKPILGYSYETIKEIPENFVGGPAFESWFGNYDKQIQEAREIGYVNADAVAEWKTMEAGEFKKGAKAVVISALIESHWDQEYPYNDLCPSLGEAEGNCVVGCVATASSLVMRYHEQDVVGYGSSSYFWSTGGQTLSIDHFTQTFDYSLMPHSGYSNQAEVDELAKLAVNWGRAVSMDYDTRANGGSGAYTTAVDNAFLDHFGYLTADYYSHTTPSTPDPAWVSTIETSLDEMLPIVYSGTGGDGGHCFNLDGYSTENWYHFNWGWGGYMDGNYQLDNLNPGSDFTQSQAGVYNIEAGPWPWNDPQNFAGSFANGEDVTLTWNDPANGAPVLTGFQIFRFGELYDTVGLVNSYQDFDLSAGEYVYYIKALYEDGVSHITPSYSASVVVNLDFPIARTLVATTVGRTSIDVTWMKPFTGVVMLAEDWETGSFDTEWHQRRTLTITPTDQVDWNTAPADPKWFHEDGSGLGPEYIHAGLWSAATGYTTPDFTWLFSPQFTLGANAELTYWVWCTGNAGSGWFSNYYIRLYSGDWTEKDPSLAMESVLDRIGIDETNGNTYETVEIEDLSMYAQIPYRLAFVYEYTDGFQMAVDDILVGTAAKNRSADIVETVHSNVIHERLVNPTILPDDSGLPAASSTKAAKSTEPTDYDLYRNDVFVTNVTVTGITELYTDLAFVDGINEYYIKANYPDPGTSIACERSAAYMDADPQPYYLSGVFNPNNVDLSWYAPYHYPPMWFGYNGEDPDSYWDMIADYFSVGNHLPGEKNRTVFNMDLGIYYPADLDSVAACFYEANAGDWDSDQFTFTVYTSATDGSDSILYGPSANLTAVSGYWTLYGLPSTLTMNQGWYIEETPGAAATTGTPSIFTTYTNDSHSTTYLDVAGDGSGYGWYYITSGDYGNDWWINGYITSSAPPPIAKNGWVSPVDAMTIQKYEKVLADAREVTTTATSQTKEMLNYNIYREGSLIGTSGTATYTDTTPVLGGVNNSYYVTALYANPAGESAPSNTIIVNTSAPADINLPQGMLNAAAASGGSDQEPFTIENLGDQDLTWSASFEYLTWPGMKADAIAHSNDFESGLVYTNSGSSNWVTGAGLTGICAIADASTNQLVTRTMTSAAFDGTVCTALALDFDQDIFKGSDRSAYFRVEYTDDGSTWYQIYNETATTTASQSLPLPNISAIMQVRFTCSLSNRSSGDLWQVDNVVVLGPEVITYDWLRLDGALTANGVITPAAGDVVVNADCDATGCIDGTYTADITILSDDLDEPSVVQAVSFVVGGSGPVIPEVPANVVTSIVSGDLVIDWDDSVDAEGYDVYSSDDPYGAFALVTSVVPSTYTVAASQAKLFYYIIATNTTKTSPKIIKVAKSVKSVR